MTNRERIAMLRCIKEELTFKDADANLAKKCDKNESRREAEKRGSFL